ncbi:YlxM family DNA-binding protein [Candidatus Sumerlaeota bacterium]|nr:YlxM family DNA-binding protein [Candidatus Sumerlaeota bacterium]
MDIYGALLTDKQRTFMRLHFEDDLSFGEIAKEYGVSRQAIHDAVKHAEKSLEDYESKLGLLGKSKRAGGEGRGSSRAEEILDALTKRLRSAGVIYNSDWIQAEVRRAIDTLHEADAPPESEDESDV